MRLIIGEYKGSSDDTNKIYVESKNGEETASFYLNSASINKVVPDTEEDYENIKITAPVIDLNGKMYVNVDGFMQGFNSVIAYNQNNNSITIQTLPYLVNRYTQKATEYKYTLSEEFQEQKALVFGMLIGSNSLKKFGVINGNTGEEIISPKYNEIKYIESSKEFLVTNSSGKVGIIYKTGNPKFATIYDEIELVDDKLQYYLVKRDSKYGVINSAEDIVIHCEYEKIGVDKSYGANNSYVLSNSIIPAYINKKWVLFDVNGKKITDEEFDYVGCTNKDMKDKVTNDVAEIDDTGVVVVGKNSEESKSDKNKKYGGINAKGDFIIPLTFERIYSVTQAGETSYYLKYNGNDYNAVEYVNARKKQLGYPEEEVNGVSVNGGNNVTEEDTDNENIKNEANDTDTDTQDITESQES